MAARGEHRYLFIGGLHKSGTSVLFKILRDHPAISGFRETGVPEDEGQFLQSVFLPARAYGGPGVFGFHPEAHLTEASPLVTAENRTRLFAEWSRYWDLRRPVLLEKSPPNLIRTRFLQAMVPDAFFIILVRHPIPVALATRRWSTATLPALIEHWLVCHETYAADRPHIRRLLEIRYEEFIADPEALLAQVYAFIDLPPQPARRKVASDLNDRYLAEWRNIRETPEGEEAIRAIQERFADRIARWGYRVEA